MCAELVLIFCLWSYQQQIDAKFFFEKWIAAEQARLPFVVELDVESQNLLGKSSDSDRQLVVFGGLDNFRHLYSLKPGTNQNGKILPGNDCIEIVEDDGFRFVIHGSHGTATSLSRAKISNENNPSDLVIIGNWLSFFQFTRNRQFDPNGDAELRFSSEVLSSGHTKLTVTSERKNLKFSAVFPKSSQFPIQIHSELTFAEGDKQVKMVQDFNRKPHRKPEVPFETATLNFQFITNNVLTTDWRTDYRMLSFRTALPADFGHTLKIADGTPVRDKDAKSGLLYEWRDGEVVPAHGPDGELKKMAETRFFVEAPPPGPSVPLLLALAAGALGVVVLIVRRIYA